MAILVVDDDEALRDTMIDLITHWGYEAFGVGHGRAALDYLGDLENPRPDLILLDGHMPVMGGEEFLRHRETREELRQIPVVVFSGTPQEIKSSTAQGYVLKPYAKDVRPFIEKFCIPKAA